MRTINAGGARGIRVKGFLLALGVTVAIHDASCAVARLDDARPARTVRLLTVGNSFSQNATLYLGDLATAAGHVLIRRQAVIGGGSLEQHWEKARRHEDDPEDPLGVYLTKRSL